MTALAPIADAPWRELFDALTLQRGYTATVVTLGTTVLGAAGGLVGSFAMLRKRALMADTLAHASLPGVAAAFLVAVALGASGKSLAILLPGAAITGVLGVLLVHALTRTGRIRPDAAMAVVLSVMFGLGIVLLSVIQKSDSGQQAGLSTFIYGQTAAMSRSDVLVIAIAAGVAAVLIGLVLKELAYASFDQSHARVTGIPVDRLDLLLMALVVLVTVVALQAVGLVLAVAILVIPPVSARLWTNRLRRMLALSVLFGALGGYGGSVASTVLERLPAGSVIVLVSGCIFAMSLILAPNRGLVAAACRSARLRFEMARDHTLRAIYELADRAGDPWVPAASLATQRGASPGRTRTLARVLAFTGHVERHADRVRLTDRGTAEARRVTRNHRLWEQYLLTYADVAPSHVDISADHAEHALGADIVDLLEHALASRGALPERLPDHTELEGADA
ncbi:MAG: iron chelate uptake ABC transporter family permease subunit [Phycisphaerales bacterium]